MGNFPWGPHGPEVPAHTTTPNPTPSDTPQLITGGGDAGAFAGGGGGGGLGAILANIIFSLVMLAMLWIPMILLYTITALAGLVTGFGLFAVLARVFPADFHDVAFVLAFAAGTVVVLKVFRVELRLAEQPSFRRMRHVVRMALFAVWAIPIVQLSMGAAAPSTSSRYILGTMTSPRGLVSFLTRPLNFMIWAAAVVGLHFLIWSAEPVRRFWHRRLVFIGLK